MVDLKLFEFILTKREEKYIDSLDYLSKELIELFLNNYNIVNIKKLFKTTDGDKFKTYFRCVKCGEESLKYISKSKFFEYISTLNKFKTIGNGELSKINNFNGLKYIPYKQEHLLCIDCINNFYRTRDEEYKNTKEEMETTIDSNTDYYIENYLNPERSWNEGVKLWEKWNDINLSSNYIHLDKIKEYITSLSYKEFLQTPYWKAIAQKIKAKYKFKCTLCNNNQNLIAHHSTYENHGLEHLHLEDLTCICSNCHSKYHHKEKEAI